MSKRAVTISDKIVSAVTYITAGWGGLIYSVILYFAKKKMSYFVKFNIFQSIFISALYFCLAIALNIIMNILSFIPFLNYLVAQITFIFNRPIIGRYSIIQIAIIGLITYTTAFAILGKLPRIYWVSGIIERQSR